MTKREHAFRLMNEDRGQFTTSLMAVDYNRIYFGYRMTPTVSEIEYDALWDATYMRAEEIRDRMILTLYKP